MKEQSGWISFEDAEFGEGVKAVKLRAACQSAASVEVRLKSPEGPIVGRVELLAGSAQEWRDYTAEVSGVSGRQDVFIVLNGKVSLSTVQFV